MYMANLLATVANQIKSKTNIHFEFLATWGM